MPKSSSATSSASIAPRCSSGFPNRSRRRNLAAYDQLLEERARDIPVAYLTGEREFMGMPFEVGPGVLVPRPETELLVAWAISWLREREREPVTVVDVGTGSGAIAIGIAAAMGPHWQGRDHRRGRLMRTPSRLPLGTALASILATASPSSRARCCRGCGVPSISFSPTSPTCVLSNLPRIPRLPPNPDWRSTAARMVSTSSVNFSPTHHASSLRAERSVWRSTPASATKSST